MAAFHACLKAAETARIRALYFSISLPGYRRTHGATSRLVSKVWYMVVKSVCVQPNWSITGANEMLPRYCR